MSFRSIIFLPFSMVYGIITHVRNLLFDRGFLPSESFTIPVISVGNLSMGGTGKTPHIEYLIRLLKDRYRLATLSRGYGRSTRGFHIAQPENSVKDVGDEPGLIKNKFPDILVAVDENRRRGVRRLMNLHPAPEVILLDDAFQHRYIEPGLSILLTDYFNLYTRDRLIPAGRLREHRSSAKRADIIVVTKTEPERSPIHEGELLAELRPDPKQKVCFSYIKYENPVSFSGEILNICSQKNGGVLMVAGIANPYPLELYLRNHFTEFKKLIFRDHHPFTASDVRDIRNVYRQMAGNDKIIITTEKDAIRMREAHLNKLLKDLPLYYLPVRIEFHSGSKQTFDTSILHYVGKGK
ncbi:MAG: tetraacyldisaccharide 4'-kinase [Bacteroidales bacterium]|nr:tetraacyldisaccharide 4'-kinase [Bacteroidales bacterium]